MNIEDPDFIAAIDELSLWSAPFGLKLLDTIRFKSNMTALDLGCGEGFPLIELAERIGRSGAVVGLDPWKQALDRAGEKCVVKKVQNAYRANCAAELNHSMIKFWFAGPWKDILIPEDVKPVLKTVENRLNEQARACGGMVLTVPFVTLDCTAHPGGGSGENGCPAAQISFGKFRKK
jgi:SAM-dependent methyltransferase